ncbi:MAG: hypothetical protein V3V08_07010 [Nannocystaceae bacterium]
MSWGSTPRCSSTGGVWCPCRGRIGAKRQQTFSERPIFAYNTSYTASGERQAAVIVGALKLIADEGRGTLQLFDLAVDPQERNNFAGRRSADLQRLYCLLRATGAFQR